MTAADAAVIALLIGFVVGWASRATRNLPRMRRMQRRRPMATLWTEEQRKARDPQEQFNRIRWEPKR